MKESYCEVGEVIASIPDIEDWRETNPDLPNFINPCKGCQLPTHLRMIQTIKERLEQSNGVEPVYRHRLTLNINKGTASVWCACECTTQES